MRRRGGMSVRVPQANGAPLEPDGLLERSRLGRFIEPVRLVVQSASTCAVSGACTQPGNADPPAAPLSLGPSSKRSEGPRMKTSHMRSGSC